MFLIVCIFYQNSREEASFTDVALHQNIARRSVTICKNDRYFCLCKDKRYHFLHNQYLLQSDAYCPTAVCLAVGAETMHANVDIDTQTPPK